MNTTPQEKLEPGAKTAHNPLMTAVESLPWEADRDELTVERVARLVVRHTPPGADSTDIKHIGSGWDNDVFSTGSVFLRFPRRDEVVEADRREARMLQALAPTFPFEVPHYVFEARPDDLFPYAWFAFEPVQGLRWDRVAYDEGEIELLTRDIAQGMSALHSFEIRKARELGLEDNRETPAIWMDGLRSQRRTLSRVLPHTVAERWESFLAGEFQLPGCPDQVRVIHNDLGGPHVRVTKNTHRLLGLIDFGDVTIGDPCIDFVGFYVERGLEFVQEIVSRYPFELPEDWPRRVAFYGRVLALKWLAEAALAGDHELLPRLEWFQQDFEPLTEGDL